MAVTLHFMAKGEAYKSMVLNFRTGANSISKVVPDVQDHYPRVHERDDCVPIDPGRVEGGGSRIWQLVELP